MSSCRALLGEHLVVNERRQSGNSLAHLGDEWSVLGVEYHRLEVGVVEQVRELVGDVAVVDVDRNGTDLESAHHGFEPLEAVLGVDADVVAWPDAEFGQKVCDAIRPLIEFGEGQPPIAID